MRNLDPHLQYMMLGVTSHAGGYLADSQMWWQKLERRLDGVAIKAVGFGANPNDAAQAAVEDFRLAIAQAIGGVVA